MTVAMEEMQGWGGLGKGEGPRGTSVAEQLRAPVWARGWVSAVSALAPLHSASLEPGWGRGVGICSKALETPGQGVNSKRRLWAQSPALPGPCWAAGVSHAGASPHRLAGTGLAPSA